MKKYQFSQTGINAMQTDIYALQDEAVYAFAAEVAKDFKRWAITYLAFTASQLRDLSNLNEQSISFLASQGSFAIRNRRPIKFVKPTDIINSSFGDKLVALSTTLSAVSNREGRFSASGELVIEITYGCKQHYPEVLEHELLAY
ncbi:hypothetical protein [Pedobacter duraquae]|nr:hypothetical protein [Pedobacter duraquae]